MTPWRDPRSGLTVHRPLQRRTPLKQRSVKQAARERIYAKRREEYLSLPENETCAFPLGCTEKATTIQHIRGRRGWRLLHVPWWEPSCWSHNSWAEDHTGEALAIGWLHRIEGPELPAGVHGGIAPSRDGASAAPEDPKGRLSTGPASAGTSSGDAA